MINPLHCILVFTLQDFCQYSKENYNKKKNVVLLCSSSEDIWGPVRSHLVIVYALTVIYGFIFIFGFFGNIITCVVVIRNKYMHTVTNFYLLSLAVSDLLLLVSGLPMEMYQIWFR